MSRRSRLALLLAVLGIGLVGSGVTAEGATDPTGSVPLPTGITWVGRTLSTSNGTWSQPPDSVSYVWLSCAPKATTCPPASGVNGGASYAPVDADIGHVIEAQLTATFGLVSVTVTSPPTAVITPVPAASGGPPSISGTLQIGQRLSETHAGWNVTPDSYSYQWQRCSGGPSSCANIGGATGPTYTLTSSDAGDQMRVIEKANSGGGTSDGAPSSLTGTVSAAAKPGKATSSTSITVSPKSAVTDQSVTLIASVGSSSSQSRPSGTLSFRNNGAVVTGCGNLAVSPSGQIVTVACPAAFSAGTLHLSAVFTPSSSSSPSGSTSPTLTTSIARAPSLVALTAPSSVRVGKVTYSASVTPASGSAGPVSPSGQVQFLDGGSPIAGCSSRPITASTATCTVNYSKMGKHQIQAAYVGDGNFISSLSTAQTVTVGSSGPRGFVTATMAWTFVFTPSYTRITQLAADGLSSGLRLSLLCRGLGCPFQKHTTTVRAPKHCHSKRKGACSAPRHMNLTTLFRRSRLRSGTTLIIEIQHSNWLGKYYRFVVRSSRAPQIVTDCLAAGSNRPGAGCT